MVTSFYLTRKLIFRLPISERPAGGIGNIERSKRGLGMRVGILGLGIGTLAAYGQPGDVYRFYEINPLVIRAG